MEYAHCKGSNLEVIKMQHVVVQAEVTTLQHLPCLYCHRCSSCDCGLLIVCISFIMMMIMLIDDDYDVDCDDYSCQFII